MTVGEKFLGREDPLGALELEAAGREYERHQRSVNKLSGILKGVRFMGEKKRKNEILSYPSPRESSEGPHSSGESLGVQPDLQASSEEGAPAEMLGFRAEAPHLASLP